MPYDEGLAERVREVLQPEADVSEKKMFGGLAFISRGHMVMGILGDALMARVGPDAYDAALGRPHTRPMDVTGKPMRGYVLIDPPGLGEDADLSAWVQRCLAFVQSLPPK